MATMSVLAIGSDRFWRLRLERILSGRGELHWLGAYAPGQARPPFLAMPSLLLLDGDDPAVERPPRKPRLQSPRRLYFYRHPQTQALRHCAHVGASACLDKLTSAEEVLRALRAVDAGLFAVSPLLLQHAMADDRPVAGSGIDWEHLSVRQREIARCVTQGLSNKQIARLLGISPETVKTHMQNIFRREGVHNRIGLREAGADGRAAARTEPSTPD